MQHDRPWRQNDGSKPRAPGETDRYGRTTADVKVNGDSLSCRQIARGAAVYWPRYDTGGMIRRQCKNITSEGN
jgi:endonuclease YncB( thermonuclease family)